MLRRGAPSLLSLRGGLRPTLMPAPNAAAQRRRMGAGNALACARGAAHRAPPTHPTKQRRRGLPAPVEPPVLRAACSASGRGRVLAVTVCGMTPPALSRLVSAIPRGVSGGTRLALGRPRWCPRLTDCGSARALVCGSRFYRLSGIFIEYGLLINCKLIYHNRYCYKNCLIHIVFTAIIVV